MRNRNLVGLPLLLLSSLLLIGCGGGSIKYRPTVYVHDHHRMDIVDANGERVYCGEKEIEQYISVHIDDFSEMIFYLQNAKMPKKIKKKLLRKMNAEAVKIKNIQK